MLLKLRCHRPTLHIRLPYTSAYHTQLSTLHSRLPTLHSGLPYTTAYATQPPTLHIYKPLALYLQYTSLVTAIFYLVANF